LGRRLRSFLCLADNRRVCPLCQNRGVEITWYGQTCVRLRGRDAVVVADAYPSIVGPTGRGVSADIATYSHPDDAPMAKAKGRRTRDGQTVIPTSLEESFAVDGPGEYEVKDVLLTGVRIFRDGSKSEGGRHGTAFVYELDGLHTIHLGDVGQLLSEEELGDIGAVDIACVPVGGLLSATKTAELVAQLDPKLVIAMPLCPDEADCAEALAKFFHEMGGEAAPQPKLSVTISTLPAETTAVLLESRGKV
jgi:L-ascorbate metabolism protein UlaG (beta-lactamase superfamily)